eukprot:scaffold2065_cov114-Isochrysis_galbana.AAC.2
MPDRKPFSSTRVRFRSSSVSQMSTISIPGLTMLCIYLRTCETGAAAAGQDCSECAERQG